MNELGFWRRLYIWFLWFGAVVSVFLGAVFGISFIIYSIDVSELLWWYLVAVIVAVLFSVLLVYWSTRAIRLRNTRHILLISVIYLFISPIHAVFHWLAAYASASDNKKNKDNDKDNANDELS